MDTVFWDGEFLWLSSQGESYISTKLFTYYTLYKLKFKVPEITGAQKSISENFLNSCFTCTQKKDNSMKLKKLDPSEKLRHPKSAVLQHFFKSRAVQNSQNCSAFDIPAFNDHIRPLYNLHLVCFAPNSSCVYNTGTSGI